VKLARLRRPKAACSLSYVEYRLNTNEAILWNTGQTMGSSSTGGVGKLRTQIGLIYSLYNNEYRNLKPTEIIMRKGLRLNEEN
jgi:hypothetical protein